MTDDPTLAAIEQRLLRAARKPLDIGTLKRISGLDFDDANFMCCAYIDVPYLLDRLRAVTAERDEARQSEAAVVRLGDLCVDRALKAERQVADVRALIEPHYGFITRAGMDDCICLKCNIGRALDPAQPQDFTRMQCARCFRYVDEHPDPCAPPATPQDTPDAPCICDYDDEDTDWHTQACVDRAATPQDTPDPHDGHPYAYVDDCPDCEAARWPSTPQP